MKYTTGMLFYKYVFFNTLYPLFQPYGNSLNRFITRIGRIDRFTIYSRAYIFPGKIFGLLDQCSQKSMSWTASSP